MSASAPAPTDIRTRGRRDPHDDSGGEPREGLPARQQLASDVTTTLRANTVLHLRVRAGLATIGLASAASALAYTWWRGDKLVDALAGKGGFDSAELLALTMPFVLFVLLGALAGLANYTTHARGVDETCRMLEVLNRIEREGEVAVSARGLIFAFEEKLQNARRAFTLQLWLGRTMFLVCLGLLVATIVSALVEAGTVATVATGAGSLVAAMLGVTKRVPHNVGRHLADVVQIQSIVTGCDRQISLLESAALAALKDDGSSGAAAHALVLEAQERIDEVVDRAVQRIERFADPGSRLGRRPPPP